MTIIKCTLLASTLKLVLCYSQTDPVHIGSNISWLLPSFASCSVYNLINPRNAAVITVFQTGATVGFAYTDRCFWSYLNNGTILLQLSNVQYSDEGTYLIYPDLKCQHSYSLSVIRDFDGIAFWQNWGPWSNCDVTCGRGTRKRQRDCSKADYCFHDDANEVSRCENNYPCKASSKNVFVLTRGNVVSPKTSTMYTTGRVDSILLISTAHTNGDVVSSPAIFTNRVMHSNGDFLSAYVTTTLQIVLADPTYSFAQPKDRIVEIPLSAIVGTGAAVIIGVLLILMCILVRRYRKRMYGSKHISDRNTSTKTIKNNQTELKSQHSSFISDQGISRDSVYHIYNEIAEDDVKSEITMNERNSVVTMDNNYVGLPKYCMPGDQQSCTYEPVVTYINALESVQLFDNTSSAEVKKYRKDNSENFVKESKSLYNPVSSTRQSTDNTGYMVSGFTRVKRIPIAYTKK